MIAKALPDGFATESVLSSFEENASDATGITQQVRDDIIRAATDRSSLIIDLAFSIEGDLRQDFIISEAIRLVGARLSELKAVVVLYRDLPLARQRIPRLIIGDADLRRKVLVCCLADSEVINGEDVEWDSDELERVVQYTMRDYADQLDDRILRRRGVFTSQLPDKHFGYWFSAENGSYELGHLISAYLRAADVHAVVFDENCEPWLTSKITEICVSLSVSVHSSAKILDSEVALELKDRAIAVIGPMWRSGTLFRTVRSQLKPLAKRTRFLSIMGLESTLDERPDFYYVKRVKDEVGVPFTVDYFVPVSHDEIQPGDWKMNIATWLGKVESPYDPWVLPSTVSMWSLLDSLPAGLEQPSPKTRRPLRTFPLLRHLDARDATWLAESIVRLGQDEFEIPRSLLIVVLPKEVLPVGGGLANGTAPLAEAFKKSLQVATLSVSREDFESETAPSTETVEFFEAHQAYEVIAVDESAVSFGSINSLYSYISRANGGRAPKFTAAIVEAVLAASVPPDSFRSLFQWHPVEAP
ncbi:MAG: hypothetical protein JWQ12_1757 [Glaciihabitans sp.]|nr:hypothetical protein [Glaciihabitans sp.]